MASNNIATYLEIADFMGSDDDFAVFPRFDRLSFCNLLHLRTTLSKLEEEFVAGAEKIPDGDVEELMEKIQCALKSYNEALLTQVSLRRSANPAGNVVELFKKYSERHLGALAEFLHLGKKGATLLPLHETEKTWAHRFVDRHLVLQKLFKDKERIGSVKNVVFYNEHHVRKVDRFLVTICFCLLLLCPIVLLSYTSRKAIKLAIVFGFVFGCSLLNAAITNARNWEILAITAGYCAILVVFLSGNTGV